jgi:hypothetical protein
MEVRERAKTLYDVRGGYLPPKSTLLNFNLAQRFTSCQLSEYS